MNKHRYDFITIYYETQDSQYLPLFEDACKKSLLLLNEFEGLAQPGRCKVYILRSWEKFLFLSHLSIFGLLSSCLGYPLWYLRYSKRWPYIGGISIPRRNAIAVKPPPIYESPEYPESAVLESAQVRDKNINRKVQTAICHELTHLFSRQLRLPLWLNEGLALLISDCFVGLQSIRPITIAFIKEYAKKTSTQVYANLATNSMNDISYQYLRGYWMLRYLLRDHPQAFSALLQKRRSRREMDQFLADIVNIPPGEFWQKIDDVLFDAFPNGYERQGYPPVTLATLMQREDEI